MSLLFGPQRARSADGLAGTLVALQTALRMGGSTGSVAVTQHTALRHSAVWASRRLRADLVSSLPAGSYRQVGGVLIEMAPPQLLVEPSPGVSWPEWMWASQFDLDGYGNCFGLIKARNALGLPTRIDLVSAGDVGVRVKDGVIVEYRIGQKTYKPEEVWHERQYAPAGMLVGLCPVAYAAWSIGAYLSAQEFALNWFGAGAVPSGILKNTEKSLTTQQASEAKRTFRAAAQSRDIIVLDKRWEYKMADAEYSSSAFLEEMRYGAVDVCRFFGVPSDLIDAAVSGQAVTYANISQRNLQLLTMNLGPVIVRREAALTTVTPRPRRVILDQDALMRMDPQTRADVQAKQITSRILTPDEARAENQRRPLTDDDYAQFDRLFPPRAATKPTTEVTP